MHVYVVMVRGVCLSSLELSFSLITASLHQATSSIAHTLNVVCVTAVRTHTHAHTHVFMHLQTVGVSFSLLELGAEFWYSGNVSHRVCVYVCATAVPYITN